MMGASRRRRTERWGRWSRLALALVAFMTSACVQRRPDAVMSPAHMDLHQLDTAYKRSLARRNVGIGLAGPGAALAILGGVLIGYGANNQNLLGAGEEIVGGSVAALVGLVLAIPGVVLWVTGQDDMDVATWRKQQMSGTAVQF
jgi:Mn2+/Fe2+ NRAMP family transporter